MGWMLPGTAERVPLHTAQEVNDRIAGRTLEDIASYSNAPRHEREAHLRDLEREWDVERALTAADGAMLLGAGLVGLLLPRRWMFVVPTAIGGFLLLHALQGWCLLMPILRRRGVRTAYEIAGERAALMRR